MKKQANTKGMDILLDAPKKVEAEATKVSANMASLRDIKSYVRSDYEYVTEPSRVPDAIRDLLEQPLIGFDCETTGLDPRTSRLRLVQLGHTRQSYIFDCNSIDPRSLQPVFDGARRIAGTNLGFDLDFVWENGINIPDGNRLYDIRNAAQVLWAGTPDGIWKNNSLANIAARVAGIYVDKEFQNSDWSNPSLSSEQLQYAAFDTYLPIALTDTLADELYACGLRDIVRLENRVLPAIVWMKRNGALLDIDAWQALISDAILEQVRLLKLMNEEAGVNQAVFGMAMVNWDSPVQVKQVFASRGYPISSSSEATLIELAAKGDQLADLIVRYRHARTRESRYGQKFLKWINPVTGRIHPEFLQMGASESGRMSCISPNMQNIPRDKRYRACFIAPPGYLVLGADYSQIELRLAAQIAHDPVLLDAYLQNIDVHSLTAQKVMGIKGKPNAEERFKAKAVNFGFIYGMGAEKFQRYAYTSYGVRLSLEEAQQFRSSFFKLYKGLLYWHRSQPQIPMETRTVLGRRSLDVDKFSEKLNYPVQGSAGDGAKLALALMWENRNQSSALPFSAIHDEILAYTPEDNKERDCLWLEKQMVDGMSQVLTAVPVVAEAGYGPNWQEAKK